MSVILVICQRAVSQNVVYLLWNIERIIRLNTGFYQLLIRLLTLWDRLLHLFCCDRSCGGVRRVRNGRRCCPMFYSFISRRTSLLGCRGALLSSGSAVVWGMVTYGRLSNTRMAHLSLFVGRLRKPASKSTPAKQLDRKGGNPELRKRKRRQTPDVVKGCWMVLHADAQMNNEEGGVVCLSMWDVSWRSIGKRDDVTGKRSESIWKFCFVRQIFQKGKIIHLLSYLLSTFKNVIFYFSVVCLSSENAGTYFHTANT